jgi:hypothetical protein
MKTVHAPQIEEVSRKVKHREGEFRYRRLLAGTPGSRGNFVLEMVTTTHDFFSPRHRHNFDQFRYQLEGEFDFDRNGKMKPGCLGYFPEGTAYGPQTSAEHALTLTLQFGGASGNGYMSADQIEVGSTALKERGVFDKGIFRLNEDIEGRRATDGYQAVWEFINQRPMVYPKPRYHDPIMMYPENFEWTCASPGVFSKSAGSFSECGTGADFVRLDPGARWTLAGRAIAFALRGAGVVQGESYGAHTTTLCEEDETAEFCASSETELLLFRLPRFAEQIKLGEAAE